ncbi:fibronectin type III domain-containing protein [Streptomyces sp. NPDC057052]|uniref:fibronectin type III domain-containing protein n=1 Tax=Streptomyces sp. NPDC057052 TaxID=3346010 RepID=UPI003631C945
MHQRFRAACATAAVIAAATAGLALPTTAHAAVTCADGVWKATYHPNTSFSGTPRLTICDTSINENYGTGDPAGVALPRDNFTVRWQTTRDFGSGGPFSFTTAVRDGIRVYVDGIRKVDMWKNVSTTQTKTVNLTLPSGRHTLRVDFVAWTGYADVKFAYAPRTSGTVDTVKPLTPTGVSAAYAPTTLKATIRWAKSPEMDLAGYRLYRRLAGTTPWTRIAAPATTSFTDSPPATGAGYQYVLRAVDKAGNESGSSPLQSVITTDRTPPPVPAGLTATDGPSGISVVWQPVAGAAHYYVHRASQIMDDESAPVYSKVATVTAPSWIDTTAREQLSHLYRVSAVDAAGNVSARSAVDGVTRGDHPPLPPADLKASPVSGTGIVVSWSASPSEDVLYYRVYRNGRLVEDKARTATYTDLYVLHDKKYDYTVTAVDDQANESVKSVPVSAVAPREGLAPDPVAGLMATPREYGVVVEWPQGESEDIWQYRLYKGEYEAGTWNYHLLWEEWSSFDEYLHYVDESPADGETVRYAVVAVDESGNSRFDTGETFSFVTVTELDLVTPTVPTPPGAPLQLTARAISEAWAELTWSCHDDDCAGATGFHVYRWDGHSSSYVRLTSDPLSAGTRFYSDTGAPTRIAHHYWVTAVLPDGTESAPAAATDADSGN